MTTMQKNPLHILQEKFGYNSFRLEQEAIIQSVLQKRDTFVLMPTGGGKSLCYQIPALMFDGLTVVISPLIALMKDQVDALRVNGISAAYLNSTQSSQEQESILKKVRSSDLKLLYLGDNPWASPCRCRLRERNPPSSDEENPSALQSR
jgi:ATP-dependent DNA helicase RecQ